MRQTELVDINVVAGDAREPVIGTHGSADVGPASEDTLVAGSSDDDDDIQLSPLDFALISFCILSVPSWMNWAFRKHRYLTLIFAWCCILCPIPANVFIPMLIVPWYIYVAFCASAYAIIDPCFFAAAFLLRGFPVTMPPDHLMIMSVCWASFLWYMCVRCESCGDACEKSLRILSYVLFPTMPPFNSFWEITLRPFWVWKNQGQVGLAFLDALIIAFDVLWLLFLINGFRSGSRLSTRSLQGPESLWSRVALSAAIQSPFRPVFELSTSFTNPTGSFNRVRQSFSMSPAAEVVSGSHHAQELKQKRKHLIEAQRQWLDSQPDSPLLPQFLFLSIQRDDLLRSTSAALLRCSRFQLSSDSNLFVKFAGEGGSDAGGLTRDWFDSVSQALVADAADPDGSSPLAQALDLTLEPRPLVKDEGAVSEQDQEKLKMLLVAGRFLAFAVLREMALPMSISTLFCKHLFGQAVTSSDLRQLDPDFYRLRIQGVLKEGGLDEMAAALGEPLTFVSAATELHREQEELKPGGSQVVVTEENKLEYIQLLCEARLCSSNRREMACMVQGFWDLLPAEILQDMKAKYNLTPLELAIMISGVHNLDVDDWRQNCRWNIENFELETWFWDVVQGMDEERRSRLLAFTTGSSRLPLGGFQDLRPLFTINSSQDSRLHLPHSHTCVNQLVLPSYASKEELREKLFQATSAVGFGFA